MLVVTGANGFIGSALVWELNQQGIIDILCVDSVSLHDRPEPLKQLKYKSFISSEDFLREILSKSSTAQSIECIFHMGACSSTTEMDRSFLKRVNTDYTQSLFEFCRDQNILFQYASSAAVYGDGSKGFSDCDDPQHFEPLNPYGQSKLDFDQWILKQPETSSRWYGFRFFNVYGPNEYHKAEQSSVAYKAFNEINRSGALRLFKSLHPKYKDGKQMRDFVYIKDITHWMYELYKHSKLPSGIYNMGSGQARCWLDLASAAFENMGKPLNIDWIDIPEHLREQYQYFTEAPMNKLLSHSILSPPQWPLEKGIEDYYKNYLNSDTPSLS